MTDPNTHARAHLRSKIVISWSQFDEIKCLMHLGFFNWNKILYAKNKQKNPQKIQLTYYRSYVKDEQRI